MKINFYSKSNNLSPDLERYAAKKMSVLEKYLSVGIIDANLELEENKAMTSGPKFRAEALVYLAKGKLRAEAKASTFRAAIDLMIPKLKKQLERYKGKKREVRR